MAKKVLFVTQEITPYVPETAMSLVGRYLPQAIQEDSHEIRTFMPRWGNINERRNQLHEVIRLSGMNLIIDDTDHPLIIKVASIQAARMQVYFIDNDDYFTKRLMGFDEDGKEYEDNGERAVFYARGVLETVKKLRWCPEVVHCHGWVSAFAPIYIKKTFCDEPSFSESKIVFSVYDDDMEHAFGDNFKNMIVFKNIPAEILADYNDNFTYLDLYKIAFDYSDAIIEASPNIRPEIKELIAAAGKPVLAYADRDNEQMAKDYGAFYDEVYDK